MKFPRVRFTVRRWMAAVAVATVGMAVWLEVERAKEQRVQAEIGAMAEALMEYRVKYPGWHGCRGPLYVRSAHERIR